jgi:hypothetical protein
MEESRQSSPRESCVLNGCYWSKQTFVRDWHSLIAGLSNLVKNPFGKGFLNKRPLGFGQVEQFPYGTPVPSSSAYSQVPVNLRCEATPSNAVRREQIQGIIR